MGFFRRMLLLLSFFLGLFITFSSGCQAPGNECWSFANGAASGGCCTGTQCGPWSPDGSAWDGSSPWYCLSTPKIAAGGTCNYNHNRDYHYNHNHNNYNNNHNNNLNFNHNHVNHNHDNYNHNNHNRTMYCPRQRSLLFTGNSWI